MCHTSDYSIAYYQYLDVDIHQKKYIILSIANDTHTHTHIQLALMPYFLLDQ